jgi:predicted nucleic acid-binding Zn ribbon protein
VRRSKRKGQPERLGKLVPRVLKDLGLGESARALRVAECWEEAVGAEIARHRRPNALRGGVLEVTVDSGPCATPWATTPRTACGCAWAEWGRRLLDPRSAFS